MSRCASCGKTAHYLVPRAQLPNYESSNGVEVFTLTAHYGETGETGLFGVPQKERTGIELSARVCAACGHVAWFVPQLNQLARFAEKGWGA
jgi:hypothetical protein